MKAFRFAAVLIAVLAVLASCTQYKIVPIPDEWLEVDDYSLSDLIQDIENASSGDTIHIRSLEVDLSKDRSMLPVMLTKPVTITGSIYVTDSGAVVSRALSRNSGDAVSIFKVADNVSARIERLTVDIQTAPAAESISAVVSIDGTAHAEISDIVVNTPSDSSEKVYAAELGQTATSDSIDISGSSSLGIVIVPENERKTEILKELEELADVELDIRTGYEVATAEELVDSLAEYNSVFLMDNITIDQIILDDGRDYRIELNSHVLEFTGYAVTVDNESSLAIENGEIRSEVAPEDINTFEVLYGSDLVMDNVKVYSEYDAFLIDEDNATLSLNNCYIETNGENAISTNAREPFVGRVISITDSEIYNNRMVGTEAAGVGIIFNIDGILNISNSHIQGGWQGVIARGGEINIIDGSSIVSTGGVNASGENEFICLFDNSFGYNWGEGNQVAYAALVVGNAQANAYKYNTKVTISDDSTIEMHRTEGYNDKAATIFMASANGYEARLYTNNNDYVNDIIENDWVWGDKCYINDSTAALPDPDLI